MNKARGTCDQHSSKRGVFRLCAEAHMRRLAEPERTLLQQGTVVRAVKNRGLAFHILSCHFLVKQGAGPLITDIGYCISPWCAQTFPRCHRWKVGVIRMVALI